jgi:hypothetical protein
MKGQGSIEFLVYVALLVFFLVIFLYSSSSRQYELIMMKQESEMKDLANNLAFEINEASRAGDGYERTFFMSLYTPSPAKYNSSIESSFVTIDYNDRSVSVPLVTRNVFGNFTPDANRINNTKGVIYVN